jgi:hypothetical protein
MLITRETDYGRWKNGSRGKQSINYASDSNYSVCGNELYDVHEKEANV